MAKPIEVLDCGEQECHSTAIAGACSLHLERNPFEVVVSGYLYHRSNAEPEWEEEPMDAAALNVSTKWAWKYHRALQRNIVGGSHDTLPRPTAHEGYAHFLQRLDETHGLQAEARFATAVTIEEMVALHQRAMSLAPPPKLACSAVACFSEFEGDVAAFRPGRSGCRRCSSRQSLLRGSHALRALSAPARTREARRPRRTRPPARLRRLSIPWSPAWWRTTLPRNEAS